MPHTYSSIKRGLDYIIRIKYCIILAFLLEVDHVDTRVRVFMVTLLLKQFVSILSFLLLHSWVVFNKFVQAA